MELSVKVCDVCRTVGRETEQYTVAKGEQQVMVDLCTPHGRPLEALLTGQTDEDEAKEAVVPVKRPAGRTAGAGRSTRRVKSLAEVADLRR